MIQKIFFNSDGLTLAANLILVPNSPKGILILHGGGASNKERFTFLQEVLAKHNFSSLAIDFRGVGESEGKFEDGNLENRLKDATNAYDKFKEYTSNIVVLGTSMGGHIAARLTEKREISELILLYAAAYGKEAEGKLLNKDFTNSIRQVNSWKNSPAITSVKNFSGSTLIVYGENDNVVPKEVWEAYKKASIHTNFFIIPMGEHLLFSANTKEEIMVKDQTTQKIIEFLQED